MFIARQHARATLVRPFRRTKSHIQLQLRNASTRLLSDQLEPQNDLAEQLKDTGLWNWTKGRKNPLGDKHRVNIVDRDLCDDIVNYIGPSLERHRGCDLLDINPGTGLWSKSLHEALQPRKHILMEPDIALYKPFLGDFLSKPNVQVVPKAGILWKDLQDVLENSIKQKVRDPASEPERNDTLLVNVNLSFCPPKKYQMFECVSTMVLYQLMSSIRTASLFQQYGLVRMLIWVSDDGKRRLLPRSAIRRRRSAFEAELALEWLHEIAGHDTEFEDRYELRDEWINMESGYRTLDRMKKAGLTMPSGRETITYKNLTANREYADQTLAGVKRPLHSRPFRQELEEAEREFTKSGDAMPSTRLKALRFRQKYDDADGFLYLNLLQERERIMKLGYESPSELPAAEAAFNERLDTVKKNTRKEWVMVRDNYHLFKQKEPVLFWDRRPFEPLATRAEDFYPRTPCTLLDLQPKAMNKYVRQHGPNARNGTISDTMLRYWWQHMLTPVPKAMDGLWPGFGDQAPSLTSIHDPAQGGSPMSKHGALAARCVTEKHWSDILEAWLEWPFAPNYTTLVGRLMDEYDNATAPDEDDSRNIETGGEVGGTF
ncbi:mitochondrial transcription factor 1 [Fusarium longipes]|uniref:rRNA adenine N(6)-methyltransferase n=1 Tax=Fusarium longipes TaxID=694270 RepID=A0A395S1E0_9HYPO|nr:mitochondrial transcription factor 1 [Fusarium longipes]